MCSLLANALIISEYFTQQLHLSDVSAQVAYQGCYVLWHLHLIMWIILYEQSQEIQAHNEHVFKFLLFFWILDLLNGEHSILDKIYSQLIEFQMTHDILSDGINFLRMAFNYSTILNFTSNIH